MAAVFFSYCHKDEDYRDRLEVHLSALKREGLISTWHDRRIVAGQEFDGKINEHLDQDAVILLLVSADFINSDYCWNVEMTRAMERHLAGEAVVIPVILRPCDWHGTPFAKLLAVPTDGKPVSQWTDVDEGFLQVVRAIRTAVGALKKEDAPVPSHASRRANATTPDIRSSNLRIKKTFTDADRDQFADAAFEYLAKYFDSSLAELKARNPGIDVSYKRLDATHFSAKIYENGKERSRCRIWLASGRSFAGGIAYSQSDQAGDNSFNESMSVEADKQGMFLKPFGMALRGRGEDARLTFEGAAEFYWSLLIEPLQKT